ncbi:hypothetical protein TREES_T100010424 [Tupaia chinensis]|uniref:Uncharacterized protein n=1 Tax=Tupaia chinensis TaxID=246437 RepID=L9LE68_TUPCH|nr:hypothetical protein TREES_T100010424 [Tupaia chinensis]
MGTARVLPGLRGRSSAEPAGGRLALMSELSLNSSGHRARLLDAGASAMWSSPGSFDVAFTGHGCPGEEPVGTPRPGSGVLSDGLVRSSLSCGLVNSYFSLKAQRSRHLLEGPTEGSAALRRDDVGFPNVDASPRLLTLNLSESWVSCVTMARHDLPQRTSHLGTSAAVAWPTVRVGCLTEVSPRNPTYPCTDKLREAAE